MAIKSISTISLRSYPVNELIPTALGYGYENTFDSHTIDP